MGEARQLLTSVIPDPPGSYDRKEWDPQLPRRRRCEATTRFRRPEATDEVRGFLSCYGLPERTEVVHGDASTLMLTQVSRASLLDRLGGLAGL